ncbi:hypothetical protein ACSS6W_007258 [Trichoderma asperelloides]
MEKINFEQEADRDENATNLSLRFFVMIVLISIKNIVKFLSRSCLSCIVNEYILCFALRSIEIDIYI